MNGGKWQGSHFVLLRVFTHISAARSDLWKGTLLAMLFCTIADLANNLTERVLIQLTDDNTPPVAINQERCQAAIAEASEVIMGRLGGRYSDLSSLKPTPLLKRICLDIVAYYLYSRRNKGDIENIRKRYEEAIKELDYIKLGQFHPPQQEAAQPVEYLSNKRKSSRMFSDDVWERY